MQQPINTQKHELYDNEQGVTAIEFALVAPILFIMIFGIIEFGLILFAGNVIEAATNNSARLAITGDNYGSGTSREEFIRTNILQLSGALMDTSQVSISCTNVGDTFQNVSQVNSGSYSCGDAIDNEATCSNMGSANDAVIYTVSYCWNFFTPLVGQFFNDNQYLIRSSMVVRNENF